MPPVLSKIARQVPASARKTRNGNRARVPTFTELANPQLRHIVNYQPGKPFAHLARDLGIDPANLVRLASNECILGPSPRAVAAMKAAAEQAHRYPETGGFELRAAIAEKFELDSAQIFVGNGTNEILDLLCRIFLGSGREAIVGENGFAVYKVVVRQAGSHPVEAPFRNFKHDLDAKLRAIRPQTRLVLLDNPCNPTGTRVSNTALEKFIGELPPHVVLVLDEAYHEYLDAPFDSLKWVRRSDAAAESSVPPRPGKHTPKVIVLRAFSKAMGLAGPRIGYCAAPRDCVALLDKMRQPYNVNSIALAGALAALGDDEHVSKVRTAVARDRAWLESQLKKLGVRFVPSCTNFILVRVGDGAGVAKQLQHHGVLVFPTTVYKLPEWIRVSIGRAEENCKFIRALEAVR